MGVTGPKQILLGVEYHPVSPACRKRRLKGSGPIQAIDDIFSGACFDVFDSRSEIPCARKWVTSTAGRRKAVKGRPKPERDYGGTTE